MRPQGELRGRGWARKQPGATKYGPRISTRTLLRVCC
jgi:hypothetical protein